MHRLRGLQQRRLELANTVGNAADGGCCILVPVGWKERDTVRASREREPRFRPDCRGSDRNAGAAAAAHASHLDPLERWFAWCESFELLLRIEICGQQISAAELLEGVEVEADDIGCRDESRIHAGTFGQGRCHGSEMRGESKEADTRRQC